MGIWGRGGFTSCGFVPICDKYPTGWIPSDTPPSGYPPIGGRYPAGWIPLGTPPSGYPPIGDRYPAGWIPSGTPPSGYPPIFGSYPTGWILRLVGILHLSAGCPIHRIHRQVGIVQLAGDIQPLGLINNPISWTRKIRAYMDVEDGGSGRKMTEAKNVRPPAWFPHSKVVPGSVWNYTFQNPPSATPNKYSD